MLVRCSTVKVKSPRDQPSSSDGLLVGTGDLGTKEAQELFNWFSDAARRSGLTVSLKKTEVLLQPANRQNHTIPGIKAGNVELKVTDKFCYLVSVLSSNTVVDNSRLSKANVAFGRLSKRLWCNHGISTATKVAVYRAAILSSLLYGCEGWTLYRHHILKLPVDQFHLRCLRKIAHIKWQEHA